MIFKGRLHNTCKDNSIRICLNKTRCIKEEINLTQIATSKITEVDSAEGVFKTTGKNGKASSGIKWTNAVEDRTEILMANVNRKIGNTMETKWKWARANIKTICSRETKLRKTHNRCNSKCLPFKIFRNKQKHIMLSS